MPATNNGWKTCSRGHKYRGSQCTVCWPGGKKRKTLSLSLRKRKKR